MKGMNFLLIVLDQIFFVEAGMEAKHDEFWLTKSVDLLNSSQGSFTLPVHVNSQSLIETVEP